MDFMVPQYSYIGIHLKIHFILSDIEAREDVVPLWLLFCESSRQGIRRFSAPRKYVASENYLQLILVVEVCPGFTIAHEILELPSMVKIGEDQLDC